MNIDIIYTLMNMTAFIIAGSIHEWAHAFSANIMGDRTAENSGRLSMNPAHHVDILGTIIVPLFRAVSGVPVLGWMKPVPVNPNNFRDASKGMALSAAAGPLSNLFQAAVAIIFLNLLFISQQFFQVPFLTSLYEFFTLYYTINISLMVFNLLPIPPLDGSRIVRHMISADSKIKFDRFSRYGVFILYILLYLGIFRFILTPVTGFAYLVLFLFMGGNFFLSFIPALLTGGIILLLFRKYLHEIKMHVQFGKKRGTVSQSVSLFEKQVNRISSRNRRLEKTVSLLLEKKANNELDIKGDKKLIEKIEANCDSFSRLCDNRIINPSEERCLDCSYYCNCLMRELDLYSISGNNRN